MLKILITKHLLKEESLLMTDKDKFALDGKDAPELKEARKENSTIHGICIYCDIEIANHPKDFN